MSRLLRVLTFSTLFPSGARPGHGIFVETRLRELVKSGRVESRVVAPVPWFPSGAERFGEYARFARTPRRETRNGLDVLHPRYALPPKVGMSVAPLLLALGARGAVRRLLDEGFEFDVIDAHYYYPDGVAAALLAQWFGKPFTVTARGSDLNLISRYALPRRMMRWAADRAAASIGVSAALVDVLRGWGLAPDRLHVMRNGVDLQRFRPQPRAQARAALGLSGDPLLLSVGNLVALKGHELVIDALAELLPTRPGARLVVVGAGPLRESLAAHARARGLAAQVRFAGAIPNTEMLSWYSAADALVLASSREGWPNVLLEAMACGTPVVATDVGGIPEIVTAAVAGRIVRERSARALCAAITALLASAPSQDDVRRFAQGFDWQATTAAQIELFTSMTTWSPCDA